MYGLGLALARAVVELHEGNDLGRGPAGGRLRVRVRAGLEASGARPKRAARARGRQPWRGPAGARAEALALRLFALLLAPPRAQRGRRRQGRRPVQGGASRTRTTRCACRRRWCSASSATARAVPPLIKALADQNKTVRGIAAQALGQLGDAAAVDPLRELLQRESDPFVRGAGREGRWRRCPGGRRAAARRAKIYLNFGPFTGGVKSAGPEAAKIIHEALARASWASCPSSRCRSAPADQHNFAKTGHARVLHRRQHHPARGHAGGRRRRRPTATSR